MILCLMRKCWSVYFGHEIFLFFFCLPSSSNQRGGGSSFIVGVALTLSTHTLLVWFFPLSHSNKCVHSSKQNNNKPIWPGRRRYHINKISYWVAAAAAINAGIYTKCKQKREQIISCWMHAQTGIRTRTSHAICAHTHSITHNRSGPCRHSATFNMLEYTQNPNHIVNECCVFVWKLAGNISNISSRSTIGIGTYQ